MWTVNRRTFTAAATLVALLAGAEQAVAQIAPEGGMRRANGLVVYLGVVPAAAVRGHPPAHAERRMHGGETPTGRHDYHLVVAIFDAATGERVSDASVTASVHGLAHVGQPSFSLQPMDVADAASYGGFVTLPSTDTYRAAVEIRRPGRSPVRAEFTYRHAAP